MTAALAFKWGRDFKAWVGKTVNATAGEVNGKAAVLLRAVDVKGGAGKRDVSVTEVSPPAPTVPPVLEKLREMGDELETTSAVFVRISKHPNRPGYELLDANGQAWYGPVEIVDALKALKAKDREIGVTHFGFDIETVFEVKGGVH